MSLDSDMALLTILVSVSFLMRIILCGVVICMDGIKQHGSNTCAPFSVHIDLTSLSRITCCDIDQAMFLISLNVEADVQALI